jgi:hypothetical protein
MNTCEKCLQLYATPTLFAMKKAVGEFHSADGLTSYNFIVKFTVENPPIR